MGTLTTITFFSIVVVEVRVEKLSNSKVSGGLTGILFMFH